MDIEPDLIIGDFDSANDAGFLFKSTEQIKKDNPELAAYETYDELLAAIKEHLD